MCHARIKVSDKVRPLILSEETQRRSKPFSYNFSAAHKKRQKRFPRRSWYHKTRQYCLARISVRSDVESEIDIYCSGSYIVFCPSMLHFQCMISLFLSRGWVGRWLGLGYYWFWCIVWTSEPDIYSFLSPARKLEALCAIGFVLSVYFWDPIE